MALDSQIEVPVQRLRVGMDRAEHSVAAAPEVDPRGVCLSDRRAAAAAPPRDLREVAGRLLRHFRGVFPCGGVRGKAKIHNALMDIYGISTTQAETLVEEIHVDEIQRRGFARRRGESTVVSNQRDPSKPRQFARRGIASAARIGRRVSTPALDRLKRGASGLGDHLHVACRS
jgi:hypothetical protein